MPTTAGNEGGGVGVLEKRCAKEVIDGREW